MSLQRSEMLFYIATKVTTFLGDTPLQYGTGFFYVVHLAEGDSKDVTMFVTNKHVIRGADRAMVSFHRQDRDGNPLNGEFLPVWLDLTQGVLGHPDSAVDLCTIPLGNIIATLRQRGTPIFFVSVDRNSMPPPDEWAKLEAIEKISMVGCPRGLFDEANNMPIIRSGSTATDITKQYKGKSEFLIDLACFQGSSGSPVFVYDPVGGFDRGSTSFEVGRWKQGFVGVLYAGPSMTTTGEIQLSVKPTFQFASTMHLGLVIKATEMLAFDDIIQQGFAEGLIQEAD